MTGGAPCEECNWYCVIELTGETEPASDGGTVYIARPGQHCPSCGMEFGGTHVPAPDQLVWKLPVEQEVNARS